MRCPVDNETLVIAERGGVEIDYCPKCRGVWLDRGELDKIIDRAQGELAAEPSRSAAPVHLAEPPSPDRFREDRRRYRDDDDDDDRYREYRGKRRKSILSEIFDF